jgi:hypothetical protein
LTRREFFPTTVVLLRRVIGVALSRLTWVRSWR